MRDGEAVLIPTIQYGEMYHIKGRLKGPNGTVLGPTRTTSLQNFHPEIFVPRPTPSDNEMGWARE